jgi:hypothetical protein
MDLREIPGRPGTLLMQQFKKLDLLFRRPIERGCDKPSRLRVPPLENLAEDHSWRHLSETPLDFRAPVPGEEFDEGDVVERHVGIGLGQLDEILAYRHHGHSIDPLAGQNRGLGGPPQIVR